MPEQMRIGVSKHKHLVERAVMWLKRKRYPVILPEFIAYTWNRENPDVIAFNSHHSVVIECKTSRSDFLRDKKKPCKNLIYKGMGNYRYYLCPENIIQIDDVPKIWGLIWVVEKKFILRKQAPFIPWAEICYKSEINTLVSKVRRNEVG